MVITTLAIVAATETPTRTVLEQLDPYRRTAVIMALVGLVLLAALLVVMVLLGGRMVRRMGRSARRNRAPSPSFNKKSSSGGRVRLRGETSDTLIGIGLDETRIAPPDEDSDPPVTKA